MNEYGMWCSSRWCGRRSHLRSSLWCSSQFAESLQDSPVSGLRHPQTKASDVEWSCWFRFLRVSRMTFWFESYVKISHSVTAILNLGQFKQLSSGLWWPCVSWLLAYFLEYQGPPWWELVLIIVYADSEATKNNWITGLAESHIAIALGGVILLNMSCWSSMVLLLVMSIFFISMWLGPVCRNGLMGIVASAHNPQQLKTQVEPLALHRRLRPRDTHPHNMYIYICIHKLCRLY